MNIVDGKKIAEEMKEELKKKAAEFMRAKGRRARLDIVYAGENPVIENFLRIKQKFGDEIGVETFVRRYSKEISQQSLIQAIQKASMDANSDGIIIQLPLPENFNMQEILNTLPLTKDSDVLSQKTLKQFTAGTSRLFPPVVGAVKEVLERNKIVFKNKKILVLGTGKLVGKPVAAWLTREHAGYNVANSKTENMAELLLDADIIISGVGIPGFIKPEMIKTGAVIIDAGTSEEGGKVLGDADLACAAKCALFTPVPGGLGPITVAVLFRNLLSPM